MMLLSSRTHYICKLEQQGEVNTITKGIQRDIEHSCNMLHERLFLLCATKYNTCTSTYQCIYRMNITETLPKKAPRGLLWGQQTDTAITHTHVPFVIDPRRAVHRSVRPRAAVNDQLRCGKKVAPAAGNPQQHHQVNGRDNQPGRRPRLIAARSDSDFGPTTPSTRVSSPELLARLPRPHTMQSVEE